MPRTIKEFTGQNRFLSNFWRCEVTYGGLKFNSVEAAYQAAKFAPEHLEKFVNATPAQAKKLSKTLRVEPDWDEEMKLTVMLNLLREKFSDEHLRQKLHLTGSAILVEGNDWGDRFWGVCEGEGLNWLGKLLELVRTENARHMSEISYGAFSDPLTKQTGIFTSRMEDLDELRVAIGRLYFKDVLTDSTAETAYRRLHSKVLDEINYERRKNAAVEHQYENSPEDQVATAEAD